MSSILNAVQSPRVVGERQPHVLVIDDSPDIPRLVTALLRADGVIVQSAPDGESGLAAVAEIQPDLILLDIDMPGLDGFEVCRRLKIDPKLFEIPVIFCTGLNTPEERRRGLELGATDYVTKPFDRAELRARVRSALRTKQLIDLLAQDVRRRKQGEELEHDRAQVLEMIAVGRPFDDVLVYLTSMIERHHPSGSACVMALSDGQLHAIGPSLAGGFYAALKDDSLRLAARVCSEAATDGKSIIDSTIASDSAWCTVQKVAAEHGYEACRSRLIQSPLHGVTGMVSVYFRTGQQIDSSLGQLLNTAATLASVASEHRQLSERLIYQASHDSLTGLPNRLLFEDRLQQAIALGQRVESQVGLIMFDVDRFKMINDTLGHQAGDELLLNMSKRISEVIRPSDTLARTGGDEFAVILTAPLQRDEAFQVAKRIQEVLEPRFTIGTHEVVTTVSMGIAFSPSDASDAQTLQSRADIALYRVKAMGRNGFQCYAAGMDKTFAQRVDLEYRLRAAIERNELSLHYQPQVDRTGRLVGLEALLRWNHPKLGNIPPTTFIPLAEECALIVPIGAWVLREACRQGQEWRAAGFDPITLAVNVSPIQFTQADFCELAIDTLSSTGYDPRFLELEVTESAVMGDIGDTAAKLRQLTHVGMQIAVDDFGTGHSSLAYLDRLPLHRLKIDRSFVKGLDHSAIATPARTTIVRAITSLGQNLGLSTVAEGVETMDQFNFLCDIGCDIMQGYLFSRPQPATDIARLYLHPAVRGQPLFPAVKAAS